MKIMVCFEKKQKWNIYKVCLLDLIFKIAFYLWLKRYSKRTNAFARRRRRRRVRRSCCTSKSCPAPSLFFALIKAGSNIGFCRSTWVKGRLPLVRCGITATVSLAGKDKHNGHRRHLKDNERRRHKYFRFQRARCGDSAGAPTKRGPRY